MTPREVLQFIRARREGWLDQLELHVIGAFRTVAFGREDRPRLADALPQRHKTRPRTAEEEGARWAAWAASVNQKYLKSES